MGEKVIVNNGTTRITSRVKAWSWFVNNVGVLTQQNGAIISFTPDLTSFANTRTTYQPTDWDYTDRIKRHDNATTRLIGDMHRVDFDGSNNLVDVSWEGLDTRSAYYGWKPMYARFLGSNPRYAAAPANPSSIVTTDAAFEAKMALFKKLKDKQTAFTGMTFLGELRETVQMLRRPLSGIRNGMSDYLSLVKKRGRRANADTLNRMVSSTWLEYVYGISPLLNDVQNAKEALARTIERYESIYDRFYAVGEVKSNPSSWSGFNAQPVPLVISGRYRTQNTAIVTFYGQVYQKALVGRWFDRQNLGLTLSDFVPTIWELIPYSFVADYFTNIGDLLSAANTRLNDIAWISSTTIRQSQVQHQYTGWSFQSQIPADYRRKVQAIILAPSGWVISRRQVERNATSPPTISFFKDFRLEVPGTGSTKWINLGALFAQSRSASKYLRSLAS